MTNKKATPKSSPKYTQTDINTALDALGRMYIAISKALFISTETESQTKALMDFCENFERFGLYGADLSEEEFHKVLNNLVLMFDQISTDMRNQHITIMGVN